MPETRQPERLAPRATSNRNGGRDHLGILGEIKSEYPGEIIGIRRSINYYGICLLYQPLELARQGQNKICINGLREAAGGLLLNLGK